MSFIADDKYIIKNISHRVPFLKLISFNNNKNTK